ncbi:hypothetical protein V6N13_080089 [Hibiscus sabdariffa]
MSWIVRKLPSTSVVNKISEVVEIEAGNLYFKVRVEELGFSDQSTQISPGYSNFKKKAKLNSDSISITSTESSTSRSSAKGGYWQDAEEDTINAILVGKELPDCCDVENW